MKTTEEKRKEYLRMVKVDEREVAQEGKEEG